MAKENNRIINRFGNNNNNNNNNCNNNSISFEHNISIPHSYDNINFKTKDYIKYLLIGYIGAFGIGMLFFTGFKYYNLNISIRDYQKTLYNFNLYLSLLFAFVGFYYPTIVKKN